MSISANTRKLLKEYSNLMRKLREKGLVRSSNNPVGDFAEKIACETLGLTRADKNSRGYDAVDNKNKRYEIKSRRHTAENKTTILGVIRDLDKHQFDYLIVVVFNEVFGIDGIWKLPWSVVKKESIFRPYQNGWVLNFSGSVMKNSNIKRIA